VIIIIDSAAAGISRWRSGRDCLKNTRAIDQHRSATIEDDVDSWERTTEEPARDQHHMFKSSQNLHINLHILTSIAIYLIYYHAKLADARDLKSAGRKGHEGSIPSARGMLRSASFQSRNPFGDEEWKTLASTPNAVHRFVFVLRGRGLSFYVTFVLDQSGERAYRMWEPSVFSVQMAGKRSKEFGQTNSKVGRANSSPARDLQQRNWLKLHSFPAQFLHSQDLPCYLQLVQ
jgi:hypothetical protein